MFDIDTYRMYQFDTCLNPYLYQTCYVRKD